LTIVTTNLGFGEWPTVFGDRHTAISSSGGGYRCIPAGSVAKSNISANMQR
jgi:hypothetical protein